MTVAIKTLGGTYAACLKCGVATRSAASALDWHAKQRRAQGSASRRFEEIGSSTIQSRALGGLSNGTLVFCMPGSKNACQTAWKRILHNQLDVNFKPCNFVELIPRFNER